MKRPSKDWKTPELTVLGDFEKLTRELPPKVFGIGDNAMFQGQSVMWDIDQNGFIGS